MPAEVFERGRVAHHVLEAGSVGAGEAAEQGLGHPRRQLAQIVVVGRIDVAAGQRGPARRFQSLDAEPVERLRRERPVSCDLPARYGQEIGYRIAVQLQDWKERGEGKGGQSRVYLGGRPRLIKKK